MSLSDRVRPDVDVAPWVIPEIKRLETENAALKNSLRDIADMDWWCGCGCDCTTDPSPSAIAKAALGQK